MERFFNLHNGVALKYQEIQYKFADGVGYLLQNYDNIMLRGRGIEKLYKLKEAYEVQLKEAADAPEKVRDIVVCFRCFDKPNGPCKDCD